MRNFKIKAPLIVKYFQYFPQIQIHIKRKLPVSTDSFDFRLIELNLRDSLR